ncbi:MAG: ergothioneine biosynthesis protein EgtB [Acidimicrobiia bacterium]
MTNGPSKPQIVAALDEARARSLALLDPISISGQSRQVSELMSPLCWDLAHIGHYEELWLVRTLSGAEPTDPAFDDIYDAFKHPRRDRVSLPILDPAGARRFVAGVRERGLRVLDATTLDDGEPLLAGGFVYGMVVQHEHQHDETMLATIQLMDDFAHPDADGSSDRQPDHQNAEIDGAADVLIPGGTFVVGTSDDPWAYDNERPEHEVTVAPFRIDTTPTTNGAYHEFVDAGGYDDSRLWTHAGWAWRKEAALEAPQFWHREGDRAWSRRRFGRVEDLPIDEPVQHVCWYEADAFARWSGARLPTETEWEIAAAGATIEHSNLWRAGPHRFGPSDVTRPPAAAASKWGVRQMLGEVWEWTASDFGRYPGFAPFPYQEYSEVFFGPEYKVLRGGSWATHPTAMRTSFRNWDYPIRRQIFSGFRCARDA